MRSGTNYARAVLELNFHCTVLQNLFGWKHGYFSLAVSNSRIASIMKNHGGVVFVTKHPLDSIYSLFTYYKSVGRNIRAGDEWEDFLRRPIFLNINENTESAEYRFANPVDLWNSINWNYLSAGKVCPTFHIKYEDAYSIPQETFLAAAEFLGLARRTEGPLTVPSERLKRLGPRTLETYDQYVTGREFDKRDYYETKEYLQKYSPADLEFVAANVDHELVQKLGYEI